MLIAIVGSDGSGKSTVGTILLDWLAQSSSVELHHLGKQSGAIGRAIARWPLMGRGLDRRIVSRAETTRRDDGPGFLTALVVYALSMRRVRRFRRMLRARKPGVTILTDRFPQLGTPGPMDGLGLSIDKGGWFARTLARRERDHYRWMVGHRPDLVLRLNVDLATALARKPDHRPASLERKVRDVARLTFEGAPIVDIDATLPLAEVVETAKRAIEARRRELAAT